MERFDVIIIGAGMTGCMLARELSFYRVDVAVMEKSSYVCGGQSKANGAIIHGGHDPEPGTFKARMNLEGNAAFQGLCEELGVSFHRTGIWVIAFDGTELAVLRELLARGEINGVKGLRLIGPEEIRKAEPAVSRRAVAALSIPTGGIVDVHRLVIALAEQAAVNGCRFFLEEQVVGLVKKGSRVLGVVTPGGEYRCTLVINCAGVDADVIMRMAGIDRFFTIPRKGEYYVFDQLDGPVVTRPCFQVPIPGGKGITIFPTTGGNVVIGGDSVVVQDRTDTSTTAEGFDLVLESVRRIVPDIDPGHVIAGFSGIRAVSSTGDFLVEKPAEVEGLINIAGIASPGLSAAPAIARHAIDLIRENVMDLEPSAGKSRSRRIRPLAREVSAEEREAMVRQNPAYGRIVCRCEDVTEGDIVSAIHAPVGARTIDAIKFRTRAGSGRCQGAFDIGRIVRIISRETGIRPVDVVKNERRTNIVSGYTRSGDK